MSMARRFADTLKDHAYAPGTSFRPSPNVIAILWAAGALIGLFYMMSDWRVFTAGIFALMTLVMVLAKPEYGFYFMIFILPMNLTNIQYGGTHIYKMAFYPYMFALTLTVAAVFIRGGVYKTVSYLPRTPITGIMVFTVVYLWITVLWAPHTQLALSLGVLLPLNVCIFFMVIHFIRGADSMRRTINVLMISGVIASTGVIVSQWGSYYSKTLFLGHELILEIFFGKQGTKCCGLSSRAEISGFLNMLALLAVGRLIAAERSRDMVLHGFLAAFMTAGIILTDSRGAFLGLVIGIVFLMVAHPFTRSKFLRYSAITFAFLFAIMLVTKPSFIDRILVGFGYTGTMYFSMGELKKSSFASSEDIQGGLSGMGMRANWWKKGLDAIAKEPLTLIFGLGMGGFVAHVHANSHSLPLSFFFDMGLVGVIILLIGATILLRQFVFYIVRAKRTYAYYMFVAAVAAFVAELCVHELTDYDLYTYPARFFWMGYVLAVLNIVRNENHDLEGEGRDRAC